MLYFEIIQNSSYTVTEESEPIAGHMLPPATHLLVVNKKDPQELKMLKPCPASYISETDLTDKWKLIHKKHNIEFYTKD